MVTGYKEICATCTLPNEVLKSALVSKRILHLSLADSKFVIICDLLDLWITLFWYWISLWCEHNFFIVWDLHHFRAVFDLFVQRLPVNEMSSSPISDVCCHCHWKCQNLPDESREQPLRTGSVRVLKDTETNVWRCHLILKVQPDRPSHNFPVSTHLCSLPINGSCYIWLCIMTEACCFSPCYFC